MAQGSLSAVRECTYHPDADPAAREDLEDAVRSVRLGLAARTLLTCERAYGQQRLDDLTRGLFSTLSAGLSSERAVVDDPVFQIWVRALYQAASQGQSDLALRHLERLPDVASGLSRRLAGREPRYAPGTQVAVQRDELDPYVKAVTPPSYDFTAPRPTDAGHSIDLQAELLGIAFGNLRAAWPEEYDEVCGLVKIIGHLPDATFRSCSAARYAGVVYLGNQDDSILDIEESLVHEAGHQRLYRLGEVSPVTDADAPRTPDFVLPWSGQERDLFGFLHACYIYVLLVKYFRRRRDLGGWSAEDCDRRAELILVGLLMAMPMLQGAEHLTRQGRTLVAALAHDVDVLRDELLAAAP